MGSTADATVRKGGQSFGLRTLARFGIRFVHVFGAIIVFLLLWETASALEWVNPIIIPRPSTIFDYGYQLTLDGGLLPHVFASVQRIILGFGLALAVALPLGFLLGGWFKTFETAVNPLLQVLGQANPFTLLPVFMILLGLGETSKVAIIFWVCQWPILFNTVTGIRNVDPALVKMARSLGISKFRMFYKILLPGSLPTVFTGIRMSAIFAFFILIGAEMLGATEGLGFLIHQAQSVFHMPRMWVGIVVVALLGIALNWLILQLEKRLTGWKEDITM